MDKAELQKLAGIITEEKEEKPKAKNTKCPFCGVMVEHGTLVAHIKSHHADLIKYYNDHHKDEKKKTDEKKGD